MIFKLNSDQMAMWAAAREAGVNAVAVAASCNLGDDVQAEAARRFFQAEHVVPRDQAARWGGEDRCVALTGWYARSVLPVKGARTVMMGTHIAPRLFAAMDGEKGAWERVREMVRAQGFPAGARDVYTRDGLRERGIEAEFSGCVSQCLEPVAGAGGGGWKLAVDVEPPGPEWLYVTHQRPYLSGWCLKARLEHAAKMLALYSGAGSIVTSRLHCALPAVAMGVREVVFENSGPALLNPERLTGYEPGLPATVANPTASWVLVGNGPSVLRGRLGAVIDGHDEVVRFNRYKVGGLEVHTGVKTTLWAFCGSGMLPQDVDQRPMRALQGHGAPGYEGVRLFRIPSRFYEAKRREIQQRSRRENKEVLLPSCGLLAVCWLLESGAARHLNLVGFDHFSRAVSGRHHYWLKSQHKEPREHDGETEALMLAGYKEQGRVTYLS